MWERENVLSYTARFKEIADRIADAHRFNNGGPVYNAFKQNLERDVIQCFIRRLGPEFKIRVEEKDTLREVIKNFSRNRNYNFNNKKICLQNRNNNLEAIIILFYNKAATRIAIVCIEICTIIITMLIILNYQIK